MSVESMTHEERLNSLYETGWADRPGVDAIASGFIPSIYGHLTIENSYRNPKIYAKAFLRVRELIGFDTGPIFGHPAGGVVEFGGKIAYPHSESGIQSPTIIKFPVNKVGDVDELQIGDPSKIEEINKKIEGARFVLNNYPKGERNPSIDIGDSFSWAGNIAGIEKLILWTHTEPDLAKTLINKVQTFQQDLIQYVLSELGDIIFFEAASSDSNDLITAAQFETFALPPILNCHNRARSIGAKKWIVHLCGDQNKNISFWRDVPGITGISIEFRTDLAVAIRNLGNIMTIAGNIEAMHLQMADFDALYQEAMSKLEYAASRSKRGFAISAGCEIPIDSSAVNLYSIVRAARDYAESTEWKACKPK